MLTLLLFIARAFISGGFQAAYVYTPEVGGWAGMPGSSGGEGADGGRSSTSRNTRPGLLCLKFVLEKD